MAQALIDKKYFTLEEYFALEEQATERHEFENGEVFAMSGGTVNHSLISGNVVTALNNGLRKKTCRVFGSDLKVAIAEHQSFVYPDAMVICGKIAYTKGRTDTVTNALLIVEVLSESTESYDRGRKFKKYQTLPSFTEYVLVSQTEPLVEIFFRQDQRHWLYTFAEGLEAIIQLQSIDSEISLQDIYAKVEFLPAE